MHLNEILMTSALGNLNQVDGVFFFFFSLYLLLLLGITVCAPFPGRIEGTAGGAQVMMIYNEFPSWEERTNERRKKFIYIYMPGERTTFSGFFIIK